MEENKLVPAEFKMIDTDSFNQKAMQMEENNSFIVDLQAPKQVSYCSMQATTAAEKKSLYNSINSTEKRVGDCINEVINVKDVYVEIVKCVNKETGEETSCPRTVLIDDKGVGYQAVSLGVFNGLKKIFQIFGQPNTWETPLPLKVKQLTKGERKILTFEIK